VFTSLGQQIPLQDVSDEFGSDFAKSNSVNNALGQGLPNSFQNFEDSTDKWCAFLDYQKLAACAFFEMILSVKRLSQTITFGYKNLSGFEWPDTTLHVYFSWMKVCLSPYRGSRRFQRAFRRLLLMMERGGLENGIFDPDVIALVNYMYPQWAGGGGTGSSGVETELVGLFLGGSGGSGLGSGFSPGGYA